jgi:hypothetical protein
MMFRECRHIKTDGKKCHSPAKRGSAFCYFHARSRRREQRMLQFRELREGMNEIQEPEPLALLCTATPNHTGDQN